MSMSARQIFQRICGIQMTCALNGLRTASVRKLPYSHSTRSCPCLWHLFALGQLFYKLFRGQFFFSWFSAIHVGACISASKPRCKKLVQSKLLPLSRSEHRSISRLLQRYHPIIPLMTSWPHDTVADSIPTLARAKLDIHVYYHASLYVTLPRVLEMYQLDVSS